MLKQNLGMVAHYSQIEWLVKSFGCYLQGHITAKFELKCPPPPFLFKPNHTQRSLSVCQNAIPHSKQRSPSQKLEFSEFWTFFFNWSKFVIFHLSTIHELDFILSFSGSIVSTRLVRVTLQGFRNKLMASVENATTFWRAHIGVRKDISRSLVSVHWSFPSSHDVFGVVK